MMDLTPNHWPCVVLAILCNSLPRRINAPAGFAWSSTRDGHIVHPERRGSLFVR